MSRRTEAVVWDFNGTLLLDTPLCYEIANRMRAERGMEPIPDFVSYRAYFRFPVVEYYRDMGYTFETETYDDICREFYALYEEGFPRCPLRPHAVETVRALRSKGIRQALLSATSSVRLREQIALHGLAKEFDLVAGTGDDYADGKAGAAKRCVEDLGVDPANVVFVGDTDHDLDVARRTGARCVLLTGGNQNDDKLRSLGVPVLEDVRFLPELL